MKRSIRWMVMVSLLAMMSAGVTQAQDEPSGPPPQQGQGRGWQGQQGVQRPIFGKITAMQDGTMQITSPDGQVVTVKLTDQTEYRKDRQPAKVTDFKVGDMVMVRGDENADHSVTAKMVGARTGGMMYGGPGGGPGGRTGGQGGGMMTNPGTLGKDYVAGEVKAIDAPKLTVLRTDNVTQVIELNEDTSLRKGRDSITMADIQVGDHIMAHGAMQNNVFVPKGVMVMNAEQWQRMQERMSQTQGNAAKPAASDTTAPKPQE